jgi:squalene-associated FAD-dependent desaturase
MRVAVIGAGLAGLAAACELADSGHAVTVLERRPWAGGKTYSFVDGETGETVDNGQHIFMGCTTAYVAFLEKLGTLGLTKRQRRLRVPVFDTNGRRSDLWAAGLPAPLHLLPSFAVYRHLSAAEKARIAGALPALLRADQRAKDVEEQTFETWLRRHGQKDAEIDRFWNLIVLPTLNCDCAAASAVQALFVFREGFLRSAHSAAIGLATVGLSELHVQPALQYIRRRGGDVRARAQVTALSVGGASAMALQLANGACERFDAYVAALPPRQLLAILPDPLKTQPPFAALAEIQYDPIVNLHFWFDAPVAAFDFAAFTGSELQWVFNRSRIERKPGAQARDSHERLTVSLSNAHRYLGESRRALEQRFLPEMHRLLPRSRAARLLHFTAIKEPEATFRPAPGIRRPGPVTPIENLFLAGAYTATDWPATMESAVRSGLAAAAAVAARAPLAQPRALAGVQ